LTEEIAAGQPTPEPSPAPVEAAPTPEQTPPVPAVNLPEKLVGKSAEEIAAGYLELEKKLGEQGRELGELRARVPQYQPQPQYYPQPQTQVPMPEFDYGKPEESVSRIVEARLEQERQQRAMYDVGRQATEAELNFNIAKEIAVSRNPRLYEGIERDVEAAAQVATRQWGLNPALLRDPKTLDRIAANIRFERGEYDRFQKPGVQPPQPSHSATPNLTRTAKAGVELDDDSRRLAKEFGLSEQEAREIIEKESGGGR
jgi:hypothetical protein